MEATIVKSDSRNQAVAERHIDEVAVKGVKVRSAGRATDRIGCDGQDRRLIVGGQAEHAGAEARRVATVDDAIRAIASEAEVPFTFPWTVPRAAPIT